MEAKMGRGILLWLLGVPIPIITEGLNDQG
jgi:hypothetical protein